MDEIETAAVITLFTNLKIVTICHPYVLLSKDELTTMMPQYVKVAFLAVLIYDTVITFDQEYRYIWQRKWRSLRSYTFSLATPHLSIPPSPSMVCTSYLKEFELLNDKLAEKLNPTLIVSAKVIRPANPERLDWERVD
ncbi:hypothetical protein PQX77_006278 [Marasmius sp. AFHP31]|nr:hypothetical protein PQX77_006278 [Marasmius sp. AFHP31]